MPETILKALSVQIQEKTRSWLTVSRKFFKLQFGAGVMSDVNPLGIATDDTDHAAKRTVKKTYFVMLRQRDIFSQ